jgi:hypothetical protein
VPPDSDNEGAEEMALLTGKSTESYEEAAREVAKQMENPNISDQLIEFDICKLSYKQGSIVGLPPTYIVEAEGELPTS